MPETQPPAETPAEIPVYQPPRPFPAKTVLGWLSFCLLLFLLGLWWGRRTPAAPVSSPADPGQILAERFNRPAATPQEIKFIFFNDENKNGVFDQTETGFTHVSLELRRQGQELPFQTIPADSKGQVTVSGLSEGNYEIRYNVADVAGLSLGDFDLQQWYQRIIPTGQSQILPTPWETLPEAGEVSVGLTAYVPQTLVVGQTQNQLFLIDKATNQIYGQSRQFTDDAWHRFGLLNGKIYYLADNALKQFDPVNQLTQTVIEPVYNVDPWLYFLNNQADTLIYLDNGEVNAITAGDWCGQGAVFDEEGYRLLTSNLRIKSQGDKQWLIAAATSNEPDEKVYLLACKDKRLTAFITNFNPNDLQPLTNPSGGRYGDLNLDIVWGEISL